MSRVLSGLLCLLLSQTPAQVPQSSPYFVDVADKAGLTADIISGEKDSKKYIIETTGTGIAILDYDNDGWEDLYVTYYGKNRLFHNQNGVFTEIAEKEGVAGPGKAWARGCARVA